MGQYSDSNRQPEDDLLALAAQQGDGMARSRLLERYLPVVKSRASGYAGGELEPEDLAQEGMIGLLRAIDGFDPHKGASFRTFALLCIDRSLISVVRASMAAKQIPAATRISLEEESDFPFAGGESPEEIVLGRDNLRMLSDTLSTMEQRVLYLYLGGCEYEDIARRLQITVKGVDNALCRARKKLRDLN